MVGNPAGYTVHVLTGDSLGAADVAINGLTIDVSSVDAIETSVQAILHDDHGERNEVSSRLAMLVPAPCHRR